MLSKSIIDKQVHQLAQRYYAPDYAGAVAERNRALTKGFTLLVTKLMHDLDDDEAFDLVVDGKNDFSIDAIYVSEPQNEFFDIYLYQTKYSANLEKSAGIGETDVAKMIATLRRFFSLTHYDVQSRLHQKLVDIQSTLADFNIPNFHIYFANNGQAWSPNTQQMIDDFLAENPEHKKRFQFHYLNHDHLFQRFERTKPVNCSLSFSGKVIDEAIHFKRSFVGKVSIAHIHALMQEHGDQLFKQNVRDFLGFSKVVNHAIRETLLDANKRDDFFFLNNGITMVCDKIDYAAGVDSVRAKITNAQIINGGQTSKTIHAVVEGHPEINFSDTYVLVRVYQIDMYADDEFVNAITTATNSQNAIFAKDLKANDPIQKEIEQGLAAYQVQYLRRRNHRRAQGMDIRMDVAAEVLLSAVLKRPQDAKYRKTLHFGDEFYADIFDQQQMNVEVIYFSVMLFKKIETLRKSADVSQHRFLPFASHLLLMLIYQRYVHVHGQPNHQNIHTCLAWLGEPSFKQSYMAALETIKLVLHQVLVDEQDLLAMVHQMKQKGFVDRLVAAI
ncbi:MAG: AIPR family protein [Gammaproteobacteria bacterium]|nr:AIPR family protein [Gammaproteobacteria bacterium]